MNVEHIDVYVLEVLDAVVVGVADYADVVKLIFEPQPVHTQKGIGGTGQASLLAGIEGEQAVRRVFTSAKTTRLPRWAMMSIS